jgi:hypothetical protein
VNNFMRNSVVFGILLGGIGVFYHYVIYIPKELKKIEVKYELCKNMADASYSVNWSKACLIQTKYDREALKSCMSDPEILSNSLMGEKWCRENYKNLDYSDECTLSKERAEELNISRDKSLKRCLDEAKARL